MHRPACNANVRASELEINIMNKNLFFRLFYKLKQKNDVERQIKILNDKSTTPFIIHKIEKYWKDKTLFECELTNTVEGVSKEQCVFNTLKIAQAISMTWEVNGPYENGVNNIIFEGVFNENTENKPLKWAHFMLDLEEL